jgi:hypothetical protein
MRQLPTQCRPSSRLPCCTHIGSIKRMSGDTDSNLDGWLVYHNPEPKKNLPRTSTRLRGRTAPNVRIQGADTIRLNAAAREFLVEARAVTIRINSQEKQFAIEPAEDDTEGTFLLYHHPNRSESRIHSIHLMNQIRALDLTSNEFPCAFEPERRGIVTQ